MFNNIRLQTFQIFQHALKVTQEYMWRTKGQIREFLNNSIHKNLITVMSDASLHTVFRLSAVGFAVIEGVNSFLLAGSSSVVAEATTQTEILAIGVAMDQCRLNGLEPGRIYTDCPEVLDFLGGDNPQCN